ncbi:hypothetical protein BELL_0921g00040, partial [Botrytis elliptica]
GDEGFEDGAAEEGEEGGEGGEEGEDLGEGEGGWECECEWECEGEGEDEEERRENVAEEEAGENRFHVVSGDETGERPPVGFGVGEEGVGSVEDGGDDAEAEVLG